MFDGNGNAPVVPNAAVLVRSQQIECRPLSASFAFSLPRRPSGHRRSIEGSEIEGGKFNVIVFRSFRVHIACEYWILWDGGGTEKEDGSNEAVLCRHCLFLSYPIRRGAQTDKINKPHYCTHRQRHPTVWGIIRKEFCVSVISVWLEIQRQRVVTFLCLSHRFSSVYFFLPRFVECGNQRPS